MQRPWLLGSALLLMSVGSVAGAQTDYSLDYTFNTSTAASFNINFTTQGGTASSLGVYAAPFTATWHSTPPPAYQSLSSFAVYCVDLDHYDVTPSTVFVESFSTAVLGDTNHTAAYWQKLEKASWLYTNYNPFVLSAAATAAQTNLAVDQNRYRIKAGALQAAIWNVVDGDADYTVTGGNFNISYLGGYGTDSSTFNGLVSQADNWLTDLKNAAPDNMDPGTLFLIDRAVSPVIGQDMLGSPPPFRPHLASVAPEGDSFWLLAAGVLPLGLFVRLRRRSPA